MLTRELPQPRKRCGAPIQSPRRRKGAQNLARGRPAGRFAEAETIAKGDLPADEATANVAYLREMLAARQGQFASSRQQGDRPGRSP